MYPCHARNSAESHRSFVPFLHVSRRRVLRVIKRERERSRPPLPPFPTPRNHRFASDTSTHLTLPPRKFPLPVRCAESVTVRRAMPADHHEALPSLLYLCGSLRPGRFMRCLHSVSCRSFFSSLFLSASLLHTHFPSEIILPAAPNLVTSQIRPQLSIKSYCKERRVRNFELVS